MVCQILKKKALAVEESDRQPAEANSDKHVFLPAWNCCDFYDMGLRGFDQLHLSLSGTVQNHKFALRITEDENIAITEVRFLDCFLKRHRAHGNRFIGAHEMYFSGFRDCREFVYHHFY